MGSIPGSERSPGEGHGNPPQYSCLENPVDRGAWRAIVHGVAESPTWMNCENQQARCLSSLMRPREGKVFPRAAQQGGLHPGTRVDTAAHARPCPPPPKEEQDQGRAQERAGLRSNHHLSCSQFSFCPFMYFAWLISCQKAELGACNRPHVAHEGKNITLWPIIENIC